MLQSFDNLFEGSNIISEHMFSCNYYSSPLHESNDVSHISIKEIWYFSNNRSKCPPPPSWKEFLWVEKLSLLISSQIEPKNIQTQKLNSLQVLELLRASNFSLWIFQMRVFVQIEPRHFRDGFARVQGSLRYALSPKFK